MPAQAADWVETIDFDESGFPTVDTTLVSAPGGSTTLTYDIFSGSGNPGEQPTAGSDGTTDLTVTIDVVESSNNTWGSFWSPTRDPHALYRKSNSDFASFFTITNNTVSSQTDCPKENAWAYVKVDFKFSGALASIQAGRFVTEHFSTNGPSQAYEYTIVTINGDERSSGGFISLSTVNQIVEAALANYDNVSDYMTGTTMSEHVLGVTDSDGSPGGLMQEGFWAIDDFNVDLIDPIAPQDTTVSVSGDQKISGSSATDPTIVTPRITLDGDFGLDATDIVSQITYYFGLQDVAQETYDVERDDQCTQVTHSGGANVAKFIIGYEETTAITLAAFGAEQTADGTEITWTTAAEIDNAGFNVYGGPTANGPWQKLNASLLPATGGPEQSEPYSFMDSSGFAFFMLEDVDINGRGTRHGPASVVQRGTGGSQHSPILYLPTIY